MDSNYPIQAMLHQPKQLPRQPLVVPPQGAPLLPIDDFFLLDNPNKYGEDEKQLRIKVAAVYRLIEQNGWSMGIYNHVTVSINLSIILLII